MEARFVLARNSCVRVLTVVIVTCLSAVIDLHAHTGNFIIPVFEIPSNSLPDLYDGSLEDWEATLPSASMDQSFFTQLEFGEAPTDPGTIAFRVFLAWHYSSQRIFVAVEMADDHFIDDVISDGISIMIDGDHSGGLFGRIAEPAESAQAQVIGLSFRGPLPTSPHFSLTPRLSGLEGQGNVLGEGPSLVTVELAITPWDGTSEDGFSDPRRTRLRPNSFIGLNMVISDVDEPNSGTVERGGLRRYALAPSYFTAPSVDGWQTDASQFADAELVPCFVGDCSAESATSVRVDSWGRIKASLK